MTCWQRDWLTIAFNVAAIMFLAAVAWVVVDVSIARATEPDDVEIVAESDVEVVVDDEGEIETSSIKIKPRFTHDDVVQALEGQSVMTRRIIYCEVGRSGRYDPYAVGGMGEVGPAQLLPGRGNGLSIFYSWGFDDPNDPEQAVAFVNEVQHRGMLASQYARTRFGCAGSV